MQTKASKEDADSKYLDNALKTEYEKIYTRLGSFSHRDSPSDPLLTRSGIKGSGLYRPQQRSSATMASSSSDEGEIRDPGLDKATTSPQMKDTSVDRQHRTRSRYSPSPSLSIEDSVVSALRRSSERRLSPRGSKRNRDDDHYSRNHRDSRRFKGQYEDRPTQRRGQQPYEDLDREGATPAGLRYDDGDRNRDRRSRTRTRSRSPYRASREAESRGSYNTKPQRDNYSGSKSDLPDRPRMNGYGNHQRQGSRDQSVSKRADGRMPTDLSNGEAKFVQGYSQKRGDSYKGERDIGRLVRGIFLTV